MDTKTIWVVRYDDGFGCAYGKAAFTTEQAAEDYVTEQSETEAASFPANYPAPFRRPGHWKVQYEIEEVPLTLVDQSREGS